MNLFQRDHPTDKLRAFNFLGDYFPSRLLTGCSLQIDSKALFLENKTKHFFKNHFPISLSTDKLSWYLTGVFASTNWYSWYWKVLCRGEKKLPTQL